MAEHPNVDFIRRGFDSFNAADVEGLSAILDESLVQHMAGANAVFSGDHHGRDNVLAMYGRIGAASGGTFQAVPEAIWANDDRAVVTYRARAERDGRTLDMLNAIVFEIRDGKITEITDIPADADAQDAFWS